MTKNAILSKNFKRLTFFATVLVVSLVLGNFVFAIWTEPSANPPGNNASAPINVSTIPQTKPARLDVSSLYDADDGSYYINPSATLTPSGVFAGSVGIGTVDPKNAKLYIRRNNINIDWTSDVFGGLTAGVLKIESGDAGINLIGKDSTRLSSYLNMSEVDDVTGVYLDSWTVWRGAWSKGSDFVISYTDGTNSFLDPLSVKFTILPNGNVGIGTANPSAKLEVNGNIKVTGGSFIDDGTTLTVPDYVFDSEYDLKSLSEVEKFVLENKHLKGLPDMDDTEGWAELSMQDRDMKLLEKIEELTLYIIELEKRVDELD